MSVSNEDGLSRLFRHHADGTYISSDNSTQFIMSERRFIELVSGMIDKAIDAGYDQCMENVDKLIALAKKEGIKIL